MIPCDPIISFVLYLKGSVSNSIYPVMFSSGFFILFFNLVLFVSSRFYKSLPPISKAYGTLCLLVTVGCHLGLWDQSFLALYYPYVFRRLQVWIHPYRLNDVFYCLYHVIGCLFTWFSS